MFSTCIFCNTSLGANEVLEEFPVGRRVAYDQANGRLWVVCTDCKRWNLSPFESRWEAIESAERAFRSTRIRASTDNIGLARLRDGTELVRIGAPLRPEFAAWRYGDQFASRRRRYLTLGAAGIAGSAAQMLGVIPGLSLLGSIASLGYSTTSIGLSWLKKSIPRTTIIDNDGIPRHLTHANFASAELDPDGRSGAWTLHLSHVHVRASGPILRALGHKERVDEAYAQKIPLTGVAAHRALVQVLPYLNRNGGSEKQLSEALLTIDRSDDLPHLIHKVASSVEVSRAYFKNSYRTNRNLVLRPTRLRLALEMFVHEQDERRAMEGELQDLETRWRDADAIAKIADSLLLPEQIESRVDEMRSARNESSAS